MGSQSLKPHLPLFPDKARAQGTQSPRIPQLHCSYVKSHKGQLLLVTLDPMTCEVPGQDKASSPPPQCLFYNPSKEEGCQPLFLHRRGEKPSCSSSHILFERSAKVQLPAQLTKETSLQLKLYQTPSSDLMACRKTSTSI
ncbi:unnamed protein product [Pleuronectes platessa]|uniref:Uncharacterized protein n=1 Tax=Pleuronectes platessa TaxID=8262 RepID=A0A9N7YG48_PLEPL|nr:unnamed protein product [Pleuronectes platessa]